MLSRRIVVSSERMLLFGFFLSLIGAGTLALSLPASWAGETRLSFLDSLFTAVSAVCVTGLITVDTALYSTFGKVVIAVLIQLGGLGIISFSTLYLAMPRRRISMKSARFIRNYYVDSVAHEARHIVRSIVVTTVLFELVGALFIYLGYRSAGSRYGFGHALFHAVSAFCNAGFSLISENLAEFNGTGAVMAPVAVLIILGGLGFVVLQDLYNRWTGRSRRVALHTRIVLLGSAVLLAAAGLGYFVFERNGVFAGLSAGDGILGAFFQSVTTRTAGFNTVSMSEMSLPSKVLTLPLMFIGGAPGSIAGGVKVTTAFLVVLSALRGIDRNEGVRFAKRRITRKTLSYAGTFVTKAALLLLSSILLLSVTENRFGKTTDFLSIVFESFSAFGTVGLSLGLTPGLTGLGKIIIMLTMFAGRVGLVSAAMHRPSRYHERVIDVPEGQVLIG